jgi:hypothetical protein
MFLQQPFSLFTFIAGGSSTGGFSYQRRTGTFLLQWRFRRYGGGPADLCRHTRNHKKVFLKDKKISPLQGRI